MTSNRANRRPVTASVEVDNVKKKVEAVLKSQMWDLIFNYEENLANKLVSEVPEYNVDWCAETPLPGDDAAFEEVINTIVNYEMNSLFANAE